MTKGNGNGPTQNGKETEMYERFYVTNIESDYHDGEMVSAIVYARSIDDISPLLEGNLAIEEVCHTDGRWLLCVDRSQIFSDDLEKLEKMLIAWARDEGGWDGMLPANGFGPFVDTKPIDMEGNKIQLAECKRGGHRDTGRGVCAECGTFL
tara:strand:- start:236 stop:688 length:453 start_codon:yes stop_codon:yes gene_type:complete